MATTKTPLLDEHIKNGLVKRKGPWYTIGEGESERQLAKSKLDAESVLISLQPQDEGNQNPSDEGPSIDDAATHESGTLPEVIPDNQDDGWEELLGKVKEVKSSVRGSMKILYKGEDTDFGTERDPHTGKYLAPAVAALPFKFYWGHRGEKSSQIIPDGDGYQCNGWTVLHKKIFKRICDDLTVFRDDTPDLDYYTFAEHVLCIADREAYIDKKLRQTLEGVKEAKGEFEGRKKAGKDLAHIKDTAEASAFIQSVDVKSLENQQKTQTLTDQIAQMSASLNEETSYDDL